MSKCVAERAILPPFIWYVELPGTVAFFPVGSIAPPEGVPLTVIGQTISFGLWAITSF